MRGVKPYSQMTVEFLLFSEAIYYAWNAKDRKKCEKRMQNDKGATVSHLAHRFRAMGVMGPYRFRSNESINAIE